MSSPKWVKFEKNGKLQEEMRQQVVSQPGVSCGQLWSKAGTFIKNQGTGFHYIHIYRLALREKRRVFPVTTKEFITWRRSLRGKIRPAGTIYAPVFG